MPNLKYSINGSTVSLPFFKTIAVNADKFVYANISGSKYYLPLLKDLASSNASKVRINLDGTVYAVCKTAEEAKVIVLTDDKYKMSDIYPDTYTTMTSIPDYLDVSQLTTMEGMFLGCAGLTSIPAFNTDRITSFYKAFWGCTSLPKEFDWIINVENARNRVSSDNANPIKMFNTSKDYDYADSGKTVERTKVEKIKISNVGSSEGYWYRCFCSQSVSYAKNDGYSATVVDAVDYGYIIRGSNTLPETPKLVLTNSKYKMGDLYPDTNWYMVEVPDKLDVSKLTTMNSMFYGCNALTTIPEMDTSNVTDMNSMFSYCNALTAIPALDTSKVTDMCAMLRFCNALTTIPELDTSNVTDMGSMLEGCESLTTVPQMNTSNVTSMNSMFCDCSNLTTVPELDTSKVTSFLRMFNGCNSLPSEFPWTIDCSALIFSGLDEIFYNSSVKTVKLKNVSSDLISSLTSQLLKGDNTLTIILVDESDNVIKTITPPAPVAVTKTIAAPFDVDNDCILDKNLQDNSTSSANKFTYDSTEKCIGNHVTKMYESSYAYIKIHTPKSLSDTISATFSYSYYSKSQYNDLSICVGESRGYMFRSSRTSTTWQNPSKAIEVFKTCDAATSSDNCYHRKKYNAVSLLPDTDYYVCLYTNTSGGYSSDYVGENGRIELRLYSIDFKYYK